MEEHVLEQMTTTAMEAAIADGPGQSQAIGLTQAPHADANQVMKETKEQLTTSISSTRQTKQMTKLQIAGLLVALAQTNLMIIAMAAVNAIGPGLQLDLGMIPMLHADASQALAIPLIQLTTQIPQTTQAQIAGPLVVLAQE